MKASRNGLTLQDQKNLWLAASESYYNRGKSRVKMSDSAFDSLNAEIERQDPKWIGAQKAGPRVANKKTEITLSQFMPSLSKFYPEKIEKRLAKMGQDLALIMDKLDGSALQLVYERGVPMQLVTRGDGTLGGDISFLIKYLNIPQKIQTKTRMVLRCEAVMKVRTFAAKYSKDYENARAVVNGWLNRMKPAAGLKDVDVVILGWYGNPMQQSLKDLKVMGFSVVAHSVLKKDQVTKVLASRRKTSVYDMDGLVVCEPQAVLSYANADKPKWVFAYKENESVADATKAEVVDVLWQDSRHSTLVPKIQIKPVRLGGTTVTFATCHNAKWMIDRGIGPGAIIQIVRSGDVIPKIVGVVTKAKPKPPSVPYEVKGVHFKALIRSKEADVRAIHKFMTVMGIEFLAQKTIAKLYDAGLTTVHDYLGDYANRFTRINKSGEVGDAMAIKIYKEFGRVFTPGVLLRDLMVASNTFDPGLGERKLKMIEACYKIEPNVLASLVKADANKQWRMMIEVPGYSEKTANLVIEGMPKFRQWLKETLKYIKVRKPVAIVKTQKKGPLSGKLVSFTSYRSAEQEQWLTDQGAEVISLGAKTQILLYKEGAKFTDKIDKARAKGIRVVTFEELKK